MTQDELAHRMIARGHSFHGVTVHKIETGARRVTIGEAIALADVLGTSLDELTLEVGAPRTLRRYVDGIVREYLRSVDLANGQLHALGELREQLRDAVRERDDRDYFAPLLEFDAGTLPLEPFEPFFRDYGLEPLHWVDVDDLRGE